MDAATEPRQYTLTERLLMRAVYTTDQLAQALAWITSKVSSVTGLGVFYDPDKQPFFDAWHETVSVRRTRLDGGRRGQPEQDGCQRCGSNSPMRLAGVVGNRSSTSRV